MVDRLALALATTAVLFGLSCVAPSPSWQQSLGPQGMGMTTEGQSFSFESVSRGFPFAAYVITGPRTPIERIQVRWSGVLLNLLSCLGLVGVIWAVVALLREYGA